MVPRSGTETVARGRERSELPLVHEVHSDRGASHASGVGMHRPQNVSARSVRQTPERMSLSPATSRALAAGGGSEGSRWCERSERPPVARTLISSTLEGSRSFRDGRYNSHSGEAFATPPWSKFIRPNGTGGRSHHRLPSVPPPAALVPLDAVLRRAARKCPSSSALAEGHEQEEA